MNHFLNYKIKIGNDIYCCFVDISIIEWFAIIVDILPFKDAHTLTDFSAKYNIIIQQWLYDELPEIVADRYDLNWYIYKHGDLYRIWSDEESMTLVLELNIAYLNDCNTKYIGVINLLRSLYKKIIGREGGLLHAAFAEYNSKGVLLAGSGGTGKTTCINRLPSDWRKLCDDTSLVVKNQGAYMVSPTVTWSNYIYNKNQKQKCEFDYDRKLSSVFFLRQSCCDACNKMNKTIAMMNILSSQQQCWHHYTNRLCRAMQKQFNDKLFDNSKKIAETIPCYLLDVSLGGKFWELIEEQLGCV